LSKKNSHPFLYFIFFQLLYGTSRVDL
jgi:hypothetical protein